MLHGEALNAKQEDKEGDASLVDISKEIESSARIQIVHLNYGAPSLSRFVRQPPDWRYGRKVSNISKI